MTDQQMNIYVESNVKTSDGWNYSWIFFGELCVCVWLLGLFALNNCTGRMNDAYFHFRSFKGQQIGFVWTFHQTKYLATKYVIWKEEAKHTKWMTTSF